MLGVEGVGAMRSLWPPRLLYAFSPLPVIPKVIRKMLGEGVEILLLAPHWLWWPWFASLVALSAAWPWRLPQARISLSQGPLVHPDPLVPTDYLALECCLLRRDQLSSRDIEIFVPPWSTGIPLGISQES